MTRTLFTLAAGTLLVAAGAALAQQPQAPARPGAPLNDADFVAKAAIGGTTEVTTAKLAEQRGRSDAVKKFARQMITDHTNANHELLTLAGKKQIPVPRTLDAKHQDAVAKLSQLQGDQFDQAYGRQMVIDHQETVALFQGEAANGRDPELKAVAAKLLPSLQMHLQMAQQLPGGGGAPGGSGAGLPK